MSLERRIIEALGEYDGFEPSPDLFGRMQRSLEQDEAHRRRVRRSATVIAFATGAVALYLDVVSDRSRFGTLVAPRWTLELLETVVMASLVVVIGPLIRRFGGIFIDDVFRLDPETGRRFLRLLDVAYYLVFSGYTLVTAQLVDLSRQAALGLLMSMSVERIGGLLLLMGVLHAATIAALPALGLVFSSSVRRFSREQAGPTAPPVSPGAVRAETVARFIVWVAAAVVAVGGVLAVGLAIGVGIGE